MCRLTDVLKASCANGWFLALLGLFLFIFAVLALSGPGRIDIIDGQPRYEVARSLVEHGDVVIRDEQIWFAVARGRDGKMFTAYRIPQSLLGVPAILLADATGAQAEARRHFFFQLTSAVAGAVLALAYACWFAKKGYSLKATIIWAVLGIFCTPNWWYSTTTFDDILGTTCILLAVVCAVTSQRQGSYLWSLAAGSWMGLAWNCKPPLGLFILPAMAAALDPNRAWFRQIGRLSLVVVGLVLGMILSWVYWWYRYPQGLDLESLPFSPPLWGQSPIAGLASLVISPAAGMFFYCPTLLLSIRGLMRCWRGARWWAASVLLAGVGFLFFLSCLSFFKGDIAWGPRYLTPLFALLWLFVPEGMASLPPLYRPVILILGLLVQLLGLSTEPHRLYIETNFPSGAYIYNPWVYFNPCISHLLQRPREIWEILWKTERSEDFTPAPSPTYALPLHDYLGGHAAVQKYHLFSSFRPWWLSQRYLSASERPVPLATTMTFLVCLTGMGIGLIFLALYGRRNSPACGPPMFYTTFDTSRESLLSRS